MSKLTVTITTDSNPARWSGNEPLEDAVAQRAAEILAERMAEYAATLDGMEDAEISATFRYYEDGETCRTVHIDTAGAAFDVQERAQQLESEICQYSAAHWQEALADALADEPSIITYREDVPLPGTNLAAGVGWGHAGQDAPGASDQVCVKGFVSLPAAYEEAETCYFKVLHPDLQFGDRVTLCGESLHADWGVCDDSECMYRGAGKDFLAPTWAEAEAAALAWAREAIAPLVAACQARLDALKRAGE